MKASPTFQLWMVALVALATLPIAFMAGQRGEPKSSEIGVTRPSSPTSQSPRPRAANSWRDAVSSDNAAARILAAMDLLDACRTREDFLTSIESIQFTADKSEKNKLLAAVFSDWLEKDPQAALAEVRRVESLRHDASRVAEAFYRWAQDSPVAASELLTQTLDGRQSDPAARPEFLDGVDPPDFILSLVAGLGQSDPALAASVLTRSTASPIRTVAIEVLLQDWYPTDTDAVRAWVTGITDPATRSLAIKVAATKAGQGDDPEAGIRWAMDLSDAAERNAALAALTGQWSQRHSAAAFAWTRDQPDSSTKFSLMPAVIRELTLVDPGAAADWLNQYDASPAMDASVAAYAKAIGNVNPEAALGSAAAITDPELRVSVIASIKRNLPISTP